MNNNNLYFKAGIVMLNVLLMFFLLGCGTHGKKNVKSTMTTKEAVIAFYNVENLFDTLDNPNTFDDDFTPEGKLKWETTRYHKKLNDLAKVISSIDSTGLPLVIGFCEVENKKVVEDLISTSSLKKGKYKIVHQESPDARGIDVALVYQENFMKIVSSDIIRINIPELDNFKTRDILYVNGIADNDDTLHFFINHWSSRRGGKKESEFKRVFIAKKLRERVDQIFAKNINAKIIIMGDMNDEPVDNSILSALKATGNRTPADKTELYNLMFDKKQNGKGTYSYKGNWNMLDNIIVSQGLLSAKSGCMTGFESSGIFSPKWIQYDNPRIGSFTPNRTYGGPNYYGGYSDHFPVYFKISIVK